MTWRDDDDDLTRDIVLVGLLIALGIGVAALGRRAAGECPQTHETPPAALQAERLIGPQG